MQRNKNQEKLLFDNDLFLKVNYLRYRETIIMKKLFTIFAFILHTPMFRGDLYIDKNAMKVYYN